MIINPHHPRFRSLIVRERLAKAVHNGIVVPQGLIAHGRGEAFDYIIGERTSQSASKATSVAAALLLAADRPVISVNGNTVALVGKDIVRLSSITKAPIEVNLFHRTRTREHLIVRYLQELGAKEILGVGKTDREIIRGISSPRRRADPQGIATADVVLIPLEDGDRAEVLKSVGKKVIAIDLNPLSRTSRVASVSIVDNIVRVIPNLIRDVIKMKKMRRDQLENLIRKFKNDQNLANSVNESIAYLRGASAK